MSTFVVGDPKLAAIYQFVDPLRNHPDITPEDRVDLRNHPKHNGQPTFITMPDHFPEIENFPNYMGGDELHGPFHEWIQSRGVWSLLYSVETYNAMLSLEAFDPDENIWVELALELFPSATNEFLARAHGKPGTYTSGCRGPLCKAANTRAQRGRYIGGASSTKQLLLEEQLALIALSYQAYLKYVKHIMWYRRTLERNPDVPYRFWSKLNLATSLLLEATDESHLV